MKQVWGILLGPMFVFLLVPPRVLVGQSLDSLITTKPAVTAIPPCVRLVGARENIGPLTVSLVTPPTENIPRSMRGRTVGVRVLVSITGKVDSIVMTEVPDRAYAARIREGLKQYRFRPAHRHGCVVAEWFEFTFQFPD